MNRSSKQKFLVALVCSLMVHIGVSAPSNSRVRTVSEAELPAAVLAAAIDDAAAMPPPGPPEFDLDGANETARIFTELMERPRT